MLYTNLLSQNNIEPGQLSKKLKGMVAEYEALQVKLASFKEKLETASDERREGIQTKIDDTKATMQELNEELVTAIPIWIKNREAMSERGKQLAAGRANKGNGGAAATTTATAPAASKPADTSTAGSQAQTAPAPPKQNAASNLPAKKSNTAAWVLGIFALLAVATAGVVVFNNNKQAL